MTVIVLLLFGCRFQEGGVASVLAYLQGLSLGILESVKK